MITQEEVAQIVYYCEEHKKSYKSRLEELNIPIWQFYDAKRKYLEKSSTHKDSMKGDFIQLTDGGAYIPNPIKQSRNKNKTNPSEELNIMNIELSLPNGAVVRIQGSINAESLNSIITASQGHV